MGLISIISYGMKNEKERLQESQSYINIYFSLFDKRYNNRETSEMFPAIEEVLE